MKSIYNMVKLSFHTVFISVILLFIIATSACKHSDDEPKDFSAAVTINPDGSTSNGAIFIPSSDDSFYLDYVKYKIVENHLEVVDADVEELRGKVTIYSPLTYKGHTYSTQKICDASFRDCRFLVEIKVPKTVTYLGDFAFYNCGALVSAFISDNVTYIGDWAFYDCRSLKNFQIPKNLTKIGKSCFYYCESLEYIDIPDKIQFIDAYAFATCKRVKNIIIPSSCSSIGMYAFASCNLNMVKLPNSLIYNDSWSVFYHSKIENMEAHLSHWTKKELYDFFIEADITNLKIY